MLFDFLHFLALYAIARVLILLGQTHLAGTEWGKVLAIF